MKIEAGQVAVVTGAASGIGFALAQGFVSRGLHVVISDVQAGPLADAEAALAAQDGRDGQVFAAPADVRSPDAVDALAAATLDRFGRVDIVCNNAGVVGPRLPMWEQDTEVWRWLLEVTLMGVVHGVRSFVPRLVRQGGGHVVNTASMGGLIPLPTLAPYNAAKHAVVALSETLHEELKPVAPGVGVSVLCPGMVATALPQTSFANRPAGLPDDAAGPPAAIERATAGHGLVLRPSDVARMTLEGIEAGRLHIITHADSSRPVRARVERLLADLPVPPDPD